MTEFQDIQQALAALREFTASPPASLPDPLLAHLQRAVGEVSPALAIGSAAEALYAFLDKLTNAGKDLLASLAAFATTFSWYELGVDGRGHGIVKAARRERGEEPPGDSWPDPADDPAPRPFFLPPPTEPLTPGIPDVPAQPDA